MNKEEKIIEQSFGRENHFRVPDGYFDDFTSKLMQQLPEDPAMGARLVAMKPSIWRRYHTAMIAVASVCAAIFSVGVYFHAEKAQPSSVSVAATGQTATTHAAYGTADAMAEYTMLDTEDMYAYIADTGY